MRIQSKYLVGFLVCVLSALVLSFSAYKWSRSPSDWYILLNIIALLFAIFAIWSGYTTILWISRACRFKNIFGVNAPNFPDGDWKQMSAIQPIVDELLKSEAFYLQAAYDAENAVLQKKPENLEQARDRAKEIATKAASVKILKKYFWSFHKLAWEWGFKVWNSHTHYTSALDRAGQEKSKKQF